MVDSVCYYILLYRKDVLILRDCEKRSDEGDVVGCDVVKIMMMMMCECQGPFPGW
jgi:hypothetical protein